MQICTIITEAYHKKYTVKNSFVAIHYSFYLHPIQIITSLAGLNSCSSHQRIIISKYKVYTLFKDNWKLGSFTHNITNRNTEAQQKAKVWLRCPKRYWRECNIFQNNQNRDSKTWEYFIFHEWQVNIFLKNRFFPQLSPKSVSIQ